MTPPGRLGAFLTAVAALPGTRDVSAPAGEGYALTIDEGQRIAVSWLAVSHDLDLHSINRGACLVTDGVHQIRIATSSRHQDASRAFALAWTIADAHQRAVTGSADVSMHVSGMTRSVHLLLGRGEFGATVQVEDPVSSTLAGLLSLQEERCLADPTALDEECVRALIAQHAGLMELARDAR